MSNKITFGAYMAKAQMNHDLVLQ